MRSCGFTWSKQRIVLCAPTSLATHRCSHWSRAASPNSWQTESRYDSQNKINSYRTFRSDKRAISRELHAGDRFSLGNTHITSAIAGYLKLVTVMNIRGCAYHSHGGPGRVDGPMMIVAKGVPGTQAWARSVSAGMPSFSGATCLEVRRADRSCRLVWMHGPFSAFSINPSYSVRSRRYVTSAPNG